MTGRSRSYKDGLYRRLRDNTEAANYLQAALEDSQSAFLVALKNVLDARKVATVARASKLNREHIYRMLANNGNPKLNSLEKILHALGLRLAIGLKETPAYKPPSNDHAWHAAWHMSSACKQRVLVYTMTAGVRDSEPLLDSAITDSGLMLWASAEGSRAHVPDHPAYAPEFEYEEGLCEMAC